MSSTVGHLCFAKTGDVCDGTSLLRKAKERRLDAAYRPIDGDGQSAWDIFACTFGTTSLRSTEAEQIAALRSLIATWMRLAIFQTMSLGEQDNRLWFVVDELDALGHIDGLKDALARIRKFGGRCVLGFQSIAQVSTIYGPGQAKTIVENCSNSLILRCSSSEGGGTAQLASALIGKREVVRETVIENTESHAVLDKVRGHSYGEQHVVEDAVMASQIEALPDRAGFLKFASSPAWNYVEFHYDYTMR